jgi:hypothetical protein
MMDRATNSAPWEISSSEEDVKQIKDVLRERIFAKTIYPMWLEEPEVENICRSVVEASALRRAV